MRLDDCYGFAVALSVVLVVIQLFHVVTSTAGSGPGPGGQQASSLPLAHSMTSEHNK